VVWVALLAGIGCLAGLAVNGVDAADLKAHAVHAVATVEATGQDGRDRSYLREGSGVGFGSVVLPAIWLAALAAFFLWTARSALTAEPTGVAGWLLGLGRSSSEGYPIFEASGGGPSLSAKKRRRRKKRAAKRSRTR
jgi:hypothetical protein